MLYQYYIRYYKILFYSLALRELFVSSSAGLLFWFMACCIIQEGLGVGKRVGVMGGDRVTGGWVEGRVRDPARFYECCVFSAF